MLYFVKEYVSKECIQTINETCIVLVLVQE